MSINKTSGNTSIDYAFVFTLVCIGIVIALAIIGANLNGILDSAAHNVGR